MAAAFGFARTIVAGAALIMATACGGGGGEQPLTAHSATSGTPIIGGNPPTTASVGDPYTFTPEALDPDGDALHFRATHLPAWASLDPNTGKLTGIPRAGDEGVYGGITIRVSDGRAEAVLPAFSLEVSQYATGRLAVSWNAPTQYANGAPLVHLAGYRIEYGRDRHDFDHHLLIGNPSINTALVDGLPTGTWYFAVVAFDNRSFESEPSELASSTIY